MQPEMFENCTPHAINVHLADGSIVVIPPSGFVARVEAVYTEANDCWPVPRVTKEMGEVDIGEWKYLELGDGQDPIRRIKIVSGMVLDALPKWKTECVAAPDTDKGCVRNEKGQVVGTRRFIVRTW